ncbi:hypothetical protein AGMMS49974_05380 [Deltaproteobacteria bacterium]|nr:hypothetical protein AGMMS49974_05380 [Deltaproteobacteria bacterium]GHU98368.1 hypothetical protein AGMMS50248_04840 [Deltaproteobacteria bacterium]
MFRGNPEEFISKVSDEINKQKPAVIVEHILYMPSAEEPYKQDIFHMSKSSQEYAKAFQAKKAVQDYVFTDGTEVVVYAKLPSGPKGFYSRRPWAIIRRIGASPSSATQSNTFSLLLKPKAQWTAWNSGR